MPAHRPYYVGNAARDSVRGTGWFLGQFVAATDGLRHQTDVELKWGVHPKGELRPGGHQANGVATTVSVLVRGAMRVTFTVDGVTDEVVLSQEGDYVIFGPELVHGWEALTDAVVLSVRFPSVDVHAAAATVRSPADPRPAR